MLTSRHISHHKIRQNLDLSLRKEKELANRIAVLMAEKERRLKDIEKRVNQIHEEQQLRAEKTLRKEEVQRTLQSERRAEQTCGQLAQGLRRDLSLGLSTKQALMLQTKRSWYRQAKKQSENNMARITTFRKRELQTNQTSSQRIRLMELHAKENVRLYWKERGETIQEQRIKESQKNSQLFQHSLLNVSLLQQKQQRLLSQIRQTIQNQSNFVPIIMQAQNQPNSILPPQQYS